MPEERARHLGEGALDQVEPRAMLGCMNVLEAPGALATYRPPPWTTLHRYEPQCSTYRSGKVVQTNRTTSFCTK